PDVVDRPSRPTPCSTRCPYTTLFRSHAYQQVGQQMGNKWTTNGQQVGTDKNDKNDKEMIDAKRANKEQQKSNKVTPLRRRNQSKDRKSTRLNSSHVKTSYAGFCWRKE